MAWDLSSRMAGTPGFPDKVFFPPLEQQANKKYNIFKNYKKT